MSANGYALLSRSVKKCWVVLMSNGVLRVYNERSDILMCINECTWVRFKKDGQDLLRGIQER